MKVKVKNHLLLTLINLVSFAFSALSFADGSGGGSTALAPTESPVAPMLESTTEDHPAIEGEVDQLPYYGFEERLAGAINEGIGDTTTNDPGKVVVGEFVRYLNEQGIGVEAFAALRSEESETAATASN